MKQNDRTPFPDKHTHSSKSSMMDQVEEIANLTSQLSLSSNEIAVSQLITEIKQSLDRNQYKLVSQNLAKLLKYETFNPKIKEYFVDLCQDLTTDWLNAPQEQYLLEYIDCWMMKIYTLQNRQHFSKIIMKITIKMLELTLLNEKQTISTLSIGFSDQWDNYIQLLRTYTHISLEYGLDEVNWLICNLMMVLMLPKPDLKPNCSAYEKQPQLHGLLLKLHKTQILPIIRQQKFHKLCLLLRIFISNIQHFIKYDNILLVPSTEYPSINNCSLLTQIIKFQIIEQPTIGKCKYIKEDCLMLLMTVAESQLKPSLNFNQILQFSIHIMLYLEEISKDSQQKPTQQNKKLKRKGKGKGKSKLLFYCGQLVGAILHRNCHELVRICRQEPQTKSLKRILSLYKQTVNQVLQKIDELPQEQIVYKRLVLGFCGLLRINKMQTVLEETIKKMAPKIIRIIECQHGWHDEEVDEVHADQNQPEQEEQQQIEQEWDEEYYQKHYVASFQAEQQVENLVKSMSGIREHNASIFEQIINLFDEKQSLMWMVELERYQAQCEDD